MDKTQSYKSGMLKGAIWLSISGLIVKVLGLIYKIPLSYILSDEGMGYFNSAYTVYTLFYLICTTGIPKAISIMTSAAKSEGKEKRVNEIYSTSLLVFGAIGFSISLLFLLCAKPISHALGSTQSYFTMTMVAPSIFFTCIAGVIRGYFNGTLKFMPIAVSEAVSGIIRLILGLSFAAIGYKLGYSFAVISAMTILGTTVGSFAGFLCLLIYKRKAKDLKKTKFFTLGSRKITKELFRLSIPITLTATIGSISSIIDLTVIMRKLEAAGFSELQTSIIYGNYTTLAVPMLNLVGTLVLPLTTVLLPFVSKKSEDSTQSVISERISFIIEILSLLIFPVVTVFAFRSKEVLLILFEDSSAFMASALLATLTPAMICISFSSVLNTALEGMGETRIPLISLIIGATAKIALSVIFVGNERLGLLAIPMATGISYFISMMITVYFIKFAKRTDIKILKKSALPLFCSITAISVSSMIRTMFFKENTLFYVADLLLFGVIYITLISLVKFKTLIKVAKAAKCTK